MNNVQYFIRKMSVVIVVFIVTLKKKKLNHSWAKYLGVNKNVVIKSKISKSKQNVYIRWH